MALQPITCPFCGASEFKRDADGALVCAFCNSRFEPPHGEILCRVCGGLNPPEAQRCLQCGVTLGRQCPNCAHVNPPGTDRCEACGTPLDALASITTRTREIGEDSAVLRAERYAAVKETDQAFMSEQRARLDAEEAERLARLGRLRRQAQKQQKRLVVAVLGLIAIAVAIGTIIAVAYLVAGTP
jgi:ribosomal protein L40E